MIVKPLASKHHTELQLLTDRAAQRFADLQSIEQALATNPTRDDLADCSFAFARLVTALGGWGWWSVSKTGDLNPALVSWNKAYWLVPLDVVLANQAAAVFDRVRSLPPGSPGSLEEVLVERA